MAIDNLLTTLGRLTGEPVVITKRDVFDDSPLVARAGGTSVGSGRPLRLSGVKALNEVLVTQTALLGELAAARVFSFDSVGDLLADPPDGKLAVVQGVVFVSYRGRWIAENTPLFFDFSVNAARMYKNQAGHLVLESSVQTNSVGNYNGGGTGNKPIAGLKPRFTDLENLPVADLPRLWAEVAIHTPDMCGLSYNAFLDLEGGGDPGDVVVVVVTSTLGGVTDKYGRSGSAASITDFDIGAFAVRSGTTGNTRVVAGQSLNNGFYVVGNLPSYGGALPWTSNPVSLDVLLSGGTMPLTGETFVGGFPNAEFVGAGYVSLDGGMPKGTPVTPLTAQIGDSANNRRVVTEITSLVVGDEVLV